jgi:hypothetical protein
MTRYSARLKMLADAQNAEQKTRKVPTEFAMNAKELDQGRGEDYWTTPHEMAARAFQGYVEDKIAEKGGKSPFLNYAPQNAVIPTPWGWKRPYPAGEERKAINTALESFVGELQTRETDKGLALFSRSLEGREDRQTFQRFESLGGEKSVSLEQTLDDVDAIMGFRSPFDVSMSDQLDIDVPMAFDLDRRAIQVNPNRSMNRAEAAQYMVEEVLHGVDAVAGGRTISASSKGLAEGGAIREEVQQGERPQLPGDDAGEFGL